MIPTDEENTSFMTNDGTFYYVWMLFGMKTAGVTYQCLMFRVFTDQMKRNMEAYVDEMIIKSRSPKDQIEYLKETFQQLSKFDIH